MDVDNEYERECERGCKCGCERAPELVLPSLETLARDLKAYPGFLRKASIKSVHETIGSLDFRDLLQGFPGTNSASGGYRPVADLGEDAAVFLPSDDQTANESRDGRDEQGDSRALLFATDGIMEELVGEDPYWAGYCSVMVNAQDVAACGGYPLAAVNVISARDGQTLERIVLGMTEGCRKFGVFMCGGHTHPDASHDSISVAILGTAPVDRLLYSHTARMGDAVVFALELEGERRTRFGWNSTFDMPPGEVRKRLALPGTLAERNLLTAGKDISNPGCLGTLAMLLESSGLGATIRVDDIPRPPEDIVPYREWLKLYQGCGFVLTTRPEDAQEICDEFKRAGMAAAVCGRLDASEKLVLERDGEPSVIVLDLETEPVTGIGQPR